VSASAARLSIAYFVYFSAIGIFTPFWSPYLELRGFNPFQISLLLAIAAGVRAVGPLAFGWLADASGRPTAVLRLAALFSLLSFALLPLLSGLTGFIVLTVLFCCGWNFIAPSLDAHTLARLGRSSARYGRIRLWGSVGFIVMAWSGGVVFQHAGYELVPFVMMAFIVGTVLATISIAPTAARSPAVPGTTLRSALWSRPVLVALLVAALIAISFGPYYALFSLYLERFGYSRSVIGLLWALGVVAEVGIFATGGSMLAKYSIRTLFISAAAATALRWALIGLFPGHLLVLAGAQLLHSMGFAVLHFAVVLTAQRQFPAAATARGQALFSSVGYGAGGMLGSLLAGIVWSTISPQAAYLSAAVVVVLATLCAWAGLRGTSLDRTPAQSGREPRAEGH
jgi:PPP family 3-phenylpropionic acid transporter